MDTSVQKTQNESELPRDSLGTIPTQSRAFHPELIDRLFARLAAMYGTRFFDMWANSNIDEVKQCWAHELRMFSVDHVGVAIDGLKMNNFPPTLPEFLQLCIAARNLRPRTNVQALPGTEPRKYDPNDPDVVSARERSRSMTQRSIGGKPSAAWAYRAFEKHQSGEVIQPPATMEMIRNAIRLDAGTVTTQQERQAA